LINKKFQLKNNKEKKQITIIKIKTKKLLSFNHDRHKFGFYVVGQYEFCRPYDDMLLLLIELA
jgi:hypothetical protein